MMKRPRLLISVADQLEGDAAEGENRRHPDADEYPLVMAAGEPQRDLEGKGGEGCAHDGEAGAKAERVARQCKAPVYIWDIPDRHAKRLWTIPRGDTRSFGLSINVSGRFR
jgi:hypothetical protein